MDKGSPLKPKKITGQADHKLKSVTPSKKNSVKEGLEDMPPPGDSGGMGGGMDDSLPPPEAEMGGGMGGDMDVSGLVRELTDVISRHTGVSIDVEGAGGDEAGLDSEPPMDDMGGEPPAPDMENNPLEEAGMVGYKTQDPASRLPSGRVQEGLRGKKTIKPTSNNKTTSDNKGQLKKDLVEAVTKNVMARLAAKRAPVKK